MKKEFLSALVAMKWSTTVMKKVVHALNGVAI
jgi:hypothetical protein